MSFANRQRKARRRGRLLAMLAAAGFAAAAAAPAADTPAAASDTEARVQHLAAELRCPVCSNQSVADSNAPMAADLRQEIRRQVAAGRSDAEVRRFMVERYGEAVSYRPAMAPATLPLWLGPFALLAAAAAVLGWRVARRWRGGAGAPERKHEVAR